MNEDVDDFINSLAAMPDAYLQCRTMQHSWEEDGKFTVIDSERETTRRARGGEAVFAERLLNCIRCGMQRSDAYRITSSHGYTALQKIAATYTPPEAYYVNGAGRLGKELVLGAKFVRDTEEPPVRKRRRA
jgi:hypothetical protein